LTFIIKNVIIITIKTNKRRLIAMTTWKASILSRATQALSSTTQALSKASEFAGSTSIGRRTANLCSYATTNLSYYFSKFRLESSKTSLKQTKAQIDELIYLANRIIEQVGNRDLSTLIEENPKLDIDLPFELTLSNALAILERENAGIYTLKLNDPDIYVEKTLENHQELTNITQLIELRDSYIEVQKKYERQLITLDTDVQPALETLKEQERTADEFSAVRDEVHTQVAKTLTEKLSDYQKIQKLLQVVDKSGIGSQAFDYILLALPLSQINDLNPDEITNFLSSQIIVKTLSETELNIIRTLTSEQIDLILSSEIDTLPEEHKFIKNYGRENLDLFKSMLPSQIAAIRAIDTETLASTIINMNTEDVKEIITLATELRQNLFFELNKLSDFTTARNQLAVHSTELAQQEKLKSRVVKTRDGQKEVYKAELAQAKSIYDRRIRAVKLMDKAEEKHEINEKISKLRDKKIRLRRRLNTGRLHPKRFPNGTRMPPKDIYKEKKEQLNKKIAKETVKLKQVEKDRFALFKQTPYGRWLQNKGFWNLIFNPRYEMESVYDRRTGRIQHVAGDTHITKEAKAELFEAMKEATQLTQTEEMQQRIRDLSPEELEAVIAQLDEIVRLLPDSDLMSKFKAEISSVGKLGFVYIKNNPTLICNLLATGLMLAYSPSNPLTHISLIRSISGVIKSALKIDLSKKGIIGKALSAAEKALEYTTMTYLDGIKGLCVMGAVDALSKLPSAPKHLKAWGVTQALSGASIKTATEAAKKTFHKAVEAVSDPKAVAADVKAKAIVAIKTTAKEALKKEIKKLPKDTWNAFKSIFSALIHRKYKEFAFRSSVFLSSTAILLGCIAFPPLLILGIPLSALISYVGTAICNRKFKEEEKPISEYELYSQRMKKESRIPISSEAFEKKREEQKNIGPMVMREANEEEILKFVNEECETTFDSMAELRTAILPIDEQIKQAYPEGLATI
jgi:hypothetical protein